MEEKYIKQTRFANGLLFVLSIMVLLALCFVIGLALFLFILLLLSKDIAMIVFIIPLAIGLGFFYLIFKTGKAGQEIGVSVDQSGISFLLQRSFLYLFAKENFEKVIPWSGVYWIGEEFGRNGKFLRTIVSQEKRSYGILKNYYYRKDYQGIIDQIKLYHDFDQGQRKQINI